MTEVVFRLDIEINPDQVTVEYQDEEFAKKGVNIVFGPQNPLGPDTFGIPHKFPGVLPRIVEEIKGVNDTRQILDPKTRGLLTSLTNELDLIVRASKVWPEDY